MAELTPGQEVRMFTTNRYPTPPGGGWHGTVTRVGRTLCDVEWLGGDVVTFEMTTGRAQYGIGGYYFLTLAELAERDRKMSAVAILNRYGFVVSPNAGVTADQMEAMAAILRPDQPKEGNNR